MKVSLALAREFTKDLPSNNRLIEKIGEQLGGVEQVVDLGRKYQQAVIVKVVTVTNHPNADRLHICKIDDGRKTDSVERDDNGYIQVVCGAPNVAEGLLVVWLPPGSVVPSTFNKDPLTLEVREIRGIRSSGMLASSKELSISDNHEGILEVDSNTEPGTSFPQVYGLDDVIVDIENKMFTHRPDCFGVLGVAREIAGINHQTFASPVWYQLASEIPELNKPDLPLEVQNEIPELVPRLLLISVGGVKVGPSPLWLQIALSKIGIRPINNVVDLTNYYMILTGQPTHAYDYDKVKALDNEAEIPRICIRHPHTDEKLALLNGKATAPGPDSIVIASRDRLIGLGGIMGGIETEVDDQTTNLIVECANFDMYSVRRTSMALGIFSDASTRFTKGQSPLQNKAVLAKLVADLVKIAGASGVGQFIDDNHLAESTLNRQSLYPPISLSVDFINLRLGSELAVEEMASLLKNVEFDVIINADSLEVKAPFWRTDIEIREDIVEEIGRLYGYSELAIALPMKSLQPAQKDQLLEAKSAIRNQLSKLGANEVLTYSFVDGKILSMAGQDKDQAFELSNALSPDLRYYRLSLTPSLLDKIHPNIKSGFDRFALFEIGKVHDRKRLSNDEGVPIEDERTALVVAVDDKLASTGSAYYLAKKYLSTLVRDDLLLKPLNSDNAITNLCEPYQIGRSALVYVKSTGDFLGVVGEFRPAVTLQFKLPKYCAGFEIETASLTELINRPTTYHPIPKFPYVWQDITLNLNDKINFDQIYEFIAAKTEEMKPINSVFSLTPINIYKKNAESEEKRMSFRLKIASHEKTLITTEVNTLLDAVAAAAQERFGASRV